MGDKWTNDKLKTNCVAFDKHAKEYVMVSNGKCTLDHSNTEAFKRSHAHEDGISTGCLYEAHEAIALRPIIDSESVMVAWTYRGVRQEDLEPTSANVAVEIKSQFDKALERVNGKQKKISGKFIGRI